MKILYTGPFRLGSLTESRRQALIALGHEVVGLDQVSYLNRGPYLLRKVQSHLLIGPGILAYNRDIVSLARKSRPDLIYIDQAMYLWPRSVLALRSTGTRLVHYTSEHFEFRRYLYRHFSKTVRLYDVHVVTFPHAKSWLEGRDVKKIIMAEFGYDPLLHRPPRLTPEERCMYQSDAVFIGHWEPATEEMIVSLREDGIGVMVWGSGWKRAKNLADRRTIQPIYGEEYVKALVASKIGLCFLSKWGKNCYSVSRTFEITAVGQFLLAERTADHLSYFEEGKEAEYFTSADELVSKTRYYLAHEDERKTIARAGHERCLRSGYTHQDRMRQILEAIVG
jgi:hypothetical protein